MIVSLNIQLQLVGKLFIFMMIGVFLRKKNIITPEGKQVLSSLVIDLMLPCSIIASFLGELTMDSIRQGVVIFLLSLGIQLVCYFLGNLLYRHCIPPHRTVMRYATLCSNSGILGTPIAEGLFGTEGVFFASIFLIPLRVVMWTFGLSLFTQEKEKGNGKKIFLKTVTHPCILAVIIGIILMLTQLELPALVLDCLKSIGSSNTVVSMLLVGSILGDMEPRLLLHRDTLFFSVIRLVALPLGVWAVCALLNVSPMVRNVSVILTAMPAGSTSSILALRYGADADFASACVALTTVLSLAAVPLWCMLLA